MADRALTEAELFELKAGLSFSNAADDVLALAERLLAEHAALREVARAVDHARNLAVQDFGEQQKADDAVDATLAVLEAKFPGLLEMEG